MKQFLLSCCLFLCIATVSAQDAVYDDENVSEKPIVPSRSVTLKTRQYLDIVYPGNGWIYLGEIDGTARLRYFGRKIEADKTTFTLFTNEEGSVILHFYKNDALTGNTIDDYLAVLIHGSSTAADHVIAPSYADIVPPKPVFAKPLEPEVAPIVTEERPTDTTVHAVEQPQTTTAATEAAQSAAKSDGYGATVIQNTESEAEQASQNTAQQATTQTETSATLGAATETASSSSGDELLTKAQDAYAAKDYEQCLSYLADFFENSVDNHDKALYLRGQALEAPSDVRNIKQALAAYKALVSQYPESAEWEHARERITYIERFFFDIR